MSRLVRTTLAITASVLIAGAVVAAAIGFGGNNAASPAATTGLPPATAPVTRVTLTQDNNDTEASAEHSAGMWRQLLETLRTIVER